MTKQELMDGIAAMQRIQMANPPSSEQWRRASRVMAEMVKLLTGKYPKDACGKRAA